VILALVAVGMLLLALPGARRRPPRQLPPREWTPVAASAFVAGALAVEAALVLAAASAVGGVVSAPGLIDHCRGALAPLTVDPSLLSWGAAAVATVVAARMLRGGWEARTRARQARVEPWLGEHRPRVGFDLVVLPTRRLVAFGVPGAPPQVVISEGLIDELEPEQVEAVIGHEAAHHRLRHSTLLAVLAAVERAFGGLSFVGRSLATLRAGLEVWADEAAGARDVDARRSLRQALAGVSGSTVWTRDRVQRLERWARPGHALLRVVTYAPVAVLVLAVGALMAGWFTDAHHAFALGDPCTH